MNTATPSVATRMWLYVSDRSLTASDQEHITQYLDAFLAGWAAHGSALKAWAELHYDHIVLVAVDERVAGASGCSVDKLTRCIQELGQKLNIDFFNRLLVPLIDDTGAVRVESLNDLTAMIGDGRITPSQKLIDHTTSSYQVIKSGAWIKNAKDSWLKRFF